MIQIPVAVKLGIGAVALLVASGFAVKTYGNIRYESGYADRLSEEAQEKLKASLEASEQKKVNNEKARSIPSSDLNDYLRANGWLRAREDY